jgi:hypothetical protein
MKTHKRLRVVSIPTTLKSTLSRFKIKIKSLNKLQFQKSMNFLRIRQKKNLFTKIENFQRFWGVVILN